MLWIVRMALAAEPGALVGVVFDADGRPAAGVQVRVGAEAVVSGADGGWALVVAPGTVDLDVGSVHVDDLIVVTGLSTEVLVTLGEPPAVTVEAPEVRAVATEAPTGPPGVVAGRIVDDTGKALSGVRLFVRGVEVEATTDKDGRFTLTLPAGERDVTAIRAGYAAVHAAVVVDAAAPQTVAWTMERAGLELGELTVKAPRIEGAASSVLDERQDAATVSDVLGAEQMTRAGDSDAAAALRRVTGLTVIGGKYVYVRGLGDRYSATLLNGSALPSPEPEKRVVPLDLFPTSLLDSVVIQKTFSPDRPAEFGGGVVEVRTRSIPDDPLLSVSLSGTYDHGTTGSTVEFGDEGPTDWLGFGGAYRALPEALAEASEDHAIKAGGIFSEDGYDAEELEAFGEMIPNRWGLDPRTVPPDFGLSLSAGGKVPVGDLRLGALAGFVFNNGWGVDEGYKATYSYSADELQLKRRTDFTEVSNNVRLGGALSLGLSGDAAELTSTTLLMRTSAGTALRYLADDPTGSSDTKTTRIGWEEQQLFFEQLAGHLTLGKVDLAARYALSFATRDEPDRREYTYLVTESGDTLSQRGSWSEILYTELDDSSHDVGLDVTVPVSIVELKAGGQFFTRERTSTTRRFGYQFQGSEGIDLGAPIEEVIVPENIGAEEEGDPGYLELEENTTSSDDYTATQQTIAGYLLGNITWHPRWKTLVGARVEHAEQRVSTFELFDTSLTPVEAELVTTDVLPAATLNIGIGPAEEPERMLIRVGYGRTVSRPELRELSQVQWYDYRTGRLLYGNPELQRATIENLDARWEWYPRAGESLSAGVFFKYFDHPIESVIAVSAVSGSVGTFANATSATNLGAELDWRQRLDVVAPALRDFVFAANASFIASSVDLSDTEGNQTSDERPLQGQSPWVVNAQFSYDNPDSKTVLSLLYNVFGPRIVDVGTSGIPDTYEQPVHRLDFVASQGFAKVYAVRLKATNLLDWPARELTGGQLSEETRDGWSVGLSLSWTPI